MRASAGDRNDVAPVQLSTIHAAKGLEFDSVFVVGLEEGLLPHYYAGADAAALGEERRLLYVAVTRARRQLTLTHAASRARWGKVNVAMRSRFLDELDSPAAGVHKLDLRRDRTSRPQRWADAASWLQVQINGSRRQAPVVGAGDGAPVRHP